MDFQFFKSDFHGVPSFGYIHFDKRTSPGPGWMSINGDKPQRINFLAQVPGGVVCWTNISQNAFYHSSMAHDPRFRHDSFLVVNPLEAIEEWGLKASSLEPEVISQICSTLFARIMTIVMNIGDEYYSGKNSGKFSFTEDSLIFDVGKILPEYEQTTDLSPVNVSIGNGWNFTRTGFIPHDNKCKFISIRIPRFSFAKFLLKSNVPSGKNSVLRRQELDIIGQPILKWVLEQDVPFFADAVAINVSSENSSLYGLGSVNIKSSRHRCGWISQPELVAIQNLVPTDIKAIYLADGEVEINKNFHPAIKGFLSSPHGYASWSAGIVAETIWQAIIMPPTPLSYPAISRRSPSKHTLAGLWLNGINKANGFSMAYNFSKLGYRVISYSGSWWQIAVAPELIDPLIRHSFKFGLIPRLNDIPISMYEVKDDIAWGGSKMSHAFAQMNASRQDNLLWNFDRILLYRGEKRDSLLRGLLNEHSRLINSS